jgi:hypothetical protein
METELAGIIALPGIGRQWIPRYLLEEAKCMVCLPMGEIVHGDWDIW